MTRLIIDPLTRVEGHGRVELLLSNGRLDDVQVRMLESPRLFEKIVVGRQYDEVADLVCRICAICSAVHKLTALEAIERALDVDIPLTASTVRELLLLGGHIQSHALHLFCLVLPDFSGANSVVELLKQEDTLAKAGLELKAFGNHIQEVAGGRVIHPVNPVVGGVAYRPQRQLLAELLAGLEAWQQKWPAIVSEFVTRARFPAANVAAGIPLATASAEAFALQGQTLWVGRGKNIPAADYRKLLTEESCPESYAKLSCSADGPLLVGALARARLAKERGLAYAPELEQESIYANNHAQLGEIGWALGRARDLVELLQNTSVKAPLLTKVGPPEGGVGTAVMEAPRGLLVHQYVIDEWGYVAAADVVTPTAINQRTMKDQILADLAGETDTTQMRLVAEQIVRAFDPCISCAVHLLEI